ncbi:hypothetical protein Bbelb_329470 [Branchiostoma belcheri]|nr:hypothetical protein Bbelb_329470 [Branchiostoma belcheri]
MTSGVHQKWREDGISHHHVSDFRKVSDCITNLTKVDGISRKFMVPVISRIWYTSRLKYAHPDLGLVGDKYSRLKPPAHRPKGSKQSSRRRSGRSSDATVDLGYFMQCQGNGTNTGATPIGAYRLDPPTGRRHAVRPPAQSKHQVSGAGLVSHRSETTSMCCRLSGKVSSEEPGRWEFRSSMQSGPSTRENNSEFLTRSFAGHPTTSRPEKVCNRHIKIPIRPEACTLGRLVDSQGVLILSHMPWRESSGSGLSWCPVSVRVSERYVISFPTSYKGATHDCLTRPVSYHGIR